MNRKSRKVEMEEWRRRRNEEERKQKHNDKGSRKRRWIG
jgi:hypothetical protein